MTTMTITDTKMLPLPKPIPGGFFNPYPYTTATVQIGNSDDRLTQAQWHAYVDEIRTAIAESAVMVHFAAASHGDAPWQNYAWIFEIKKSEVSQLIAALYRIRAAYSQESIAWTSGKVEFI